MNNAAFLGANFGCAECHAKTVSGNTAISNAANHANGFVDYSGARAGGSTSYASASGACSATYCHTDGKGRRNVAFDSTNGWKAGATLGCSGCHGNDSVAGSVASNFGEPNYSNAGTGQQRANSHAKHAKLSAGPAVCGNCHSATTTTGTAISAGSTNHLNGTSTLVAGNGKSFTWTSGTKSCSSISCHFGGTALWGATITGCTACHGGDAASGSPMTTN